jgi:hypothetical protein
VVGRRGNGDDQADESKESANDDVIAAFFPVI